MAMEVDAEYYNSEDALSFCDLPTLDKDDTELDPFLDSYRANSLSSPEDDNDLFEFFVNPEILTDNIPEKEGIVFCGKPIIPLKQPNEFVNKHPRNSRFIRRESSFRKVCQLSSSSRSSDVVFSGNNRSSSFRLGGPKRPLPATGSSRCRGGGSGSFRKRKVIIGLVKFQAGPNKMELSEMRKRQSRRSPAPMFPVADHGGEPASAGRSTTWGLFRPLRCRAHFVSAWTKASLRYLPHV